MGLSQEMHQQPRPGRGVALWLTVSLCTFLLIVLAYMYMPEVEKAVVSLLTNVAAEWNLD